MKGLTAQLGGQRRNLSITLALALAGLAVIVLWLTGGLTGTSSRAPRVPAADDRYSLVVPAK